MENKKKENRQGFTLIELLIVVALLGALAALILPSMKANRTKAMEATCDFNQVSTMKALNDHYGLNGALPDCLHNGAASNTSSLVEMDLPDFTASNMQYRCTWTTLTATEAASCAAAGLKHFAFGEGETNTVASVYVGVLNDEDSSSPFLDDAEANVTFNGRGVKWWNSKADGAGGQTGRVFMVYLSPMTDWSTSGDNDWGKMVGSTLSVKKAGECKVPIDETFTYYVAYIKAFGAQNKEEEDIPALLVGTSCPECGITNP